MHLDRFWNEIHWRIESEQKITVWSVGLFEAVLALVYGKIECLEWCQKLLLISLLACLGLLSCVYLYRNARKNSEIGYLIVQLNKALGAWEEDYLIPKAVLYPPKWKNWGIDPTASWKEWFRKFITFSISLLYICFVLFACIVCIMGIIIK